MAFTYLFRSNELVPSISILPLNHCFALGPVRQDMAVSQPPFTVPEVCIESGCEKTATADFSSSYCHLSGRASSFRKLWRRRPTTANRWTGQWGRPACCSTHIKSDRKREPELWEKQLRSAISANSLTASILHFVRAAISVQRDPCLAVCH